MLAEAHGDEKLLDECVQEHDRVGHGAGQSLCGPVSICARGPQLELQGRWALKLSSAVYLGQK